jgi:hypothetical protein
MNLTIDIPEPPIALMRQVNKPIFRERHEEEKYYLQSIHIFDETGKQIDSGFVKLNDYTKGCSMVRILNKFEKHFHIFRCWEHYGDKHFETEKYTIMDLATTRCCNDYHTYQEIETGLIDCNLWGLVRCPHKTETIPESRAPFYGDLERDVYSEALLECLEPANNPNKSKSEDKLCCRLDEILNIEDACSQGLISKKRETEVLNELTCICKPCNKREIPKDVKKRAQEEVDFVLKKASQNNNQNK